MDVGIEARAYPPEQLRRLLVRHAPGRADRPSPGGPRAANAWAALRGRATPAAAAALFAPDASGKAIAEFRRLLHLATQFVGDTHASDPVTSPFALGFATKWLALAIVATFADAEPAAAASGALVRAPRASGLAVLGHTVRCAAHDGAAMLAAALGGDATGDEAFTLAELLRALPEMDAALRAWGGSSTSAHRVVPVGEHAARAPGAPVRVGVPGLTPADVARLPLAPVLEARGAWTSEADGTTAIGWIPSCSLERELETLFVRGGGAWYAEARLHGVHVPQIAVYAMALEALTAIARDSHRAWTALRFEHPAEAEIVRAFLRLAAARVPELALDELRRRADACAMPHAAGAAATDARTRVR